MKIVLYYIDLQKDFTHMLRGGNSKLTMKRAIGLVRSFPKSLNKSRKQEKWVENGLKISRKMQIFIVSFVLIFPCYCASEAEECFENCTQYKPMSPLVYCEYL